ncbi:MAG: hypothetical protein CMQ40_00185 [Gammaproteobacteria bacterium]|nr:hypothetical protein [Gammaproteobacteria bacterium]
MLLEREKIREWAMRTTGLENFGMDDFSEPMDILIHDYHKTANLNRKGFIAAWTYLHRMLSNRLRLNKVCHSNKASCQSIDRPIFIVGLPRTGSTMLHEIMDMHPKLRAPHFWEASFVPDKSFVDIFRKKFALGQIISLNALSPGFKTVHKLGTEKPHECITMQAPSMRSMQFHAANNVRTYNKWLAKCDWNPAYRYHEMYLKWLQAIDTNNSRRWILKAPGHLLSIPALFSTYPDAKIIQLHRNPVEVIPSMASLFLHIRKPFTKHIEAKEIGRDVKKQWHSAIYSTMDYRANNPSSDSKFLDINYKELISDPRTTITRILNHCDIATNDEYERTIDIYLENHPKGKHGAHTYTLSQFDLTADEVEFLFREYEAKHLSQE